MQSTLHEKIVVFAACGSFDSNTGRCAVKFVYCKRNLL